MLRRASVAAGAAVLLALTFGVTRAELLSAHETCSACHLPAAAAGEPGPALPTAAACLDCHVVQLPVHGPPEPLNSTTTDELQTVDCLACHEPHPNGRPAQLRAVETDPEGVPSGVTLDSTSRLCVTCHTDAARFRGQSGHFVRHPVGVPVPGLRAAAELPLLDVHGTDDPADDVITCVTCHRLHGEPPSRLRWTRSSEAGACRGCHVLEGEGDLLAASRGRP